MTNTQPLIRYDEKGDAAPPGKVRVMFLGGTLDHKVRPVRADEFGRPDADDHLYLDPYRRIEERYTLVRIAGYPVPWYAYVLVGHQPSRIDLIDANPGPFYRQS